MERATFLWRRLQKLEFNLHPSLKLKILFVLGGLIGIIFSGLFSVYLNLFTSESNRHSKDSGVSMKIAPPPKKTVVAKKVEKKKPKKKKSSTKPKLSQNLAQMNFGGNGLNWLSTDSITDKLAGDVDDLVMTADTVDEIPKVKETATLEYPKFARSTGTQGYVTISFMVDRKGRVKKPQVTQSEPEGIFDSYALASLEKWVFHPAKFEGKPVQVWSEQTIRFDLN